MIGAAMLNPDALKIVATRVRPEDFYSVNFGHIAAALGQAFEEDWPADPVTVSDRLQRDGLLDQVGGLGELMSIQVATPASSNAHRYAEIVHNAATRRRLIGAASEIAELGYTNPADVHDAVTRAQELVTGVAASNGSRTYSSLNPVDLAPFLTGDVELEEPALLARTDGAHLFYAGKMHVLQAPPSAGKSWIVLLCSVEVLDMGGAVVYLDYEDSPAGITARLLALGAQPDAVGQRFLYTRPDGPFALPEKVDLKAKLDQLNPDLIVIDGVAEALARDGYDEDKNADVVAWTEKYPRWLARTGAAIVMIDHVTKDPDKRNRQARGAGHKLAAVDGASYDVIVSQSFSRHKAGRLQLRVAKDRPGGVGAVGETAAFVTIEPHSDGTVVRMRVEPPPVGAPGDVWKPTHIMEKISVQLEQAAAPLTARTLKSVLGTKTDLVEQAIARLIAEGWIGEIRHGRAAHLRVLKPYRAPAEEIEPPTPVQARLTDDDLFDDNPGISTDELAERRERKQRQKEDDNGNDG